MDDTTYSDASVIRTINERFVPVRVDIDKRPDISDRYNRGGFPTTAFLSEQGELIWGATYVPPEDMRNVLKALLDAKDKGEVDAALERERMQYLDLSKALEKTEMADREFVDAVFEDIFASYDVEWGGFGTEPKFPHADAINLLLERYARTKDEELASAVRSTLDHMTEGLFDPVEGGVFRYSVKRDWKLPHFEKMLDTNLGFLGNLARARLILGEMRFEKTAEGVANYLFSNLRDPETGAFFSSQDADEEYYRLDKDLRNGRRAPKVIRDIFSGLNCRAVRTLTETGALLGKKEWAEVGREAWDATLRDHWSTANGLVRHRAGEELYLFDDQVDFLEALMSVAETQTDAESERTLMLGEDLFEGVAKAFAHPDGGFSDIRKESDAIGKLAEPDRSIAANSRWAMALGLFGAANYRPERVQEAWKILRSFPPKRTQAAGMFSAEYVLAWDALELRPQAVEIHGISGRSTISNELWLSAKRALHPSTVVMAARKAMLETPTAGRPFAVVCGETGCSKEIYESDELVRRLTMAPPGQI